MPTNPATLVFPLSIIISNATAPYIWFFSQGTGELFAIEEFDEDQDFVTITQTALGASLYPTVNAESVSEMFRNVHLYCRDSDGDTVHGDFMRSLFGA